MASKAAAEVEAGGPRVNEGKDEASVVCAADEGETRSARNAGSGRPAQVADGGEAAISTSTSDNNSKEDGCNQDSSGDQCRRRTAQSNM